ncbi:hypothetical protein SALBM311S_03528 [Streptomyces alboniger]
MPSSQFTGPKSWLNRYFITTEMDAADSTSGKKNAERNTDRSHLGIRPFTAIASTSAISNWSATARTMKTSVLRKETRTVESVRISR